MQSQARLGLEAQGISSTAYGIQNHWARRDLEGESHLTPFCLQGGSMQIPPTGTLGVQPAPQVPRTSGKIYSISSAKLHLV